MKGIKKLDTLGFMGMGKTTFENVHKNEAFILNNLSYVKTVSMFDNNAKYNAIGLNDKKPVFIAPELNVVATHCHIDM